MHVKEEEDCFLAYQHPHLRRMADTQRNAPALLQLKTLVNACDKA